jgi:hypothetical protein
MFSFTNNGQLRWLADFDPQGKPQSLSYPLDSNAVVPRAVKTCDFVEAIAFCHED